MSEDDELMDRLYRLDPSISDLPPQVGSLRFTSIKEQAMNMASEQTVHSGDQPEQKLYKRRRFQVLVGAAAAAAVVVTGINTAGLGAAPSAAAEVEAAAEGLSDITDFRLSTTSTNPVVAIGVGDGLLIEVDDGKYKIVGEEGGEVYEYIGIGDTEWIVSNGEIISKEPIEGENGAEEFSPNEAFATVIDATLESSDITDEGTEAVKGVEATRYRIEMDDTARAALSELSPDTLSLFGFFSYQEIGDDNGDTVSIETTLDDVNSFTIWTSDNLVHQIEVNADQGVTTTNFFDFNDDITITAPE